MSVKRAPAPWAHAAVDAGRFGRIAIASLHAELACAPKPGLVTPFASGSHRDMNAATFMRSLFALRSYFATIARAGAAEAHFARLRDLGIEAEAAMLAATGGINTHRGAIFSLGLLTAAAAALRAAGVRSLRADAVCIEVGVRWGCDILAAPLNPDSHGQRAARQHHVGGARVEAAAGFPRLRQIALPRLRDALRLGAERNAAIAHALMALIAATEDTNLLQRGGAAGLRFAQQRASAFLQQGGALVSGWTSRLGIIGHQFVARNLSPGGSADLVACACFLLDVERDGDWG